MSRRRDALNEQRRQRIDYLLKAYRTLTHSTHRDLSAEQAEAFENALSDVVLFGDDEQIRLARQAIAGLVDGGRPSLDQLLVSVLTALRHELDLKNDDLQQVPVVRFKGLDAHTPLSVAESWSVKRDKTEAAVVAAVTASAVCTGHDGGGSLGCGCGDLRIDRRVRVRRQHERRVAQRPLHGFIATPAANISDAAPCRRSWSRIGGSPASAVSSRNQSVMHSGFSARSPICHRDEHGPAERR